MDGPNQLMEWVQSTFPNFAFWADFSGLVGFVVTIAGFALTFGKISRAKKEIKGDLNKVNVVSELAFAISKIDEVRRLQRAFATENYEAWLFLPERYSELRRLVSAIKASNFDFHDEQLAIMQEAISQFSTTERALDAALAKKVPLKMISKMSVILSDQSDNLNIVLNEVKLRIKK